MLCEAQQSHTAHLLYSIIATKHRYFLAGQMPLSSQSLRHVRLIEFSGVTSAREDLWQVGSGLLMCRSFGKVYQGWWRGGMVAIKVVPHEGDLGEKVEIVRESLLSSSIVHPNVVSLCTI